MDTNWSQLYKPSRTASLDDIAQAIHDTVSMDEVIKVYCPGLRPRARRIPCPFHNGKDPNLSYTQHGWKCFVCGASGDAISFVKDKLGLSTRFDAMHRLNEDLRLNLPLYGEATTTFSAEAAQRKRESEERQKAVDAWWETYHAYMDEWITLDTQLRSLDLQDPARAYDRAVMIGRQTIVEYYLDSMPEEPR